MKKYLFVLVALFVSVSACAQDATNPSKSPTLLQLHQKIMNSIDGSSGRTNAAQFFENNTFNNKNPMTDVVISFYYVDDLFLNGIAKVINEQMNNKWSADNNESYWEAFGESVNYVTNLLKSHRSDQFYNGQQINRVSTGLITFLYLYYGIQEKAFRDVYNLKYLETIRKDMRIQPIDLSTWSVVHKSTSEMVSAKQ